MSFEEKVWAICKKIPKGKVSTYKDIGDILNTRAYRAIGQAMRKNPYAPTVPCHRVVQSNGTVGGFKGIKFHQEKIDLLKKEGIKFDGKKILNFEKVRYRQ